METRQAAGNNRNRTQSRPAQQPGNGSGSTSRHTNGDGAAAAATDLPMALGVVPVEAVIAAQRTQLDAMTKAGFAFMAGLTALNREIVEFGDRRARALFDGSGTAPAPADWSGLLRFQADYADHATKDYLAEATRLFDLGARVTQDSLLPLRESLTTAFDGTKRPAG